MIKKILFSAAALSFASLAMAQTPQVLWDKYFGGTGGEATCIKKTSDGGFIIAGSADNAHEDATDFVAGPDVFVVKVNADFEKQWSYCYGGTYYEKPSAIIQTADGGYAFAATKALEGVSFEAWIVKLDAQGQVQWEHHYGGSLEDRASGIAETASGDLIVSGWSRSLDGNLTQNYGFADYWVLRLNASGVLQDSFTYGGSDNDNATALVVNEDGTMVVAGESFSESNDVTCRNPGICESDYWVVKLSTSGTILWAKCFGSQYSGPNFFNRPEAMIKTADGGYMIVGKGRDNNAEQSFGKYDFWVLKLDGDGNLQWKQNYGGSEDDIARAVRQTTDGGYVIAGDSMSNDNQVSVDFSSTFLSSMRNGWIIKIAANGSLQWQKAVGSDFGMDQLNDIVEITPGEYAAVGLPGLQSNNHTANSAGRRFWILRLSESSLASPDAAPNSFRLYPNPAKDAVFIESGVPVKSVRITDLSGRTVLSLSGAINQIDLGSLASGVYTVSVATETGVGVRKLVRR